MEGVIHNGSYKSSDAITVLLKNNKYEKEYRKTKITLLE